MKELLFDFNCIGGLANIYAIPPSSLSAITIDYETGRRSITLSGTSDVVSIPRYADETFSFSEHHERDEHGDYWEPTIQGVIPKASLDNASLIEELERGEWVVLVQDHNGVVRLCGDKDTPLTFATDAGSGEVYADRNHTTFTITGKLGHPSWVLDYEP